MRVFGLFYDSGHILTDTAYGDAAYAMQDAHFWTEVLGVAVNVWSNKRERVIRMIPTKPTFEWHERDGEE